MKYTRNDVAGIDPMHDEDIPDDESEEWVNEVLAAMLHGFEHGLVLPDPKNLLVFDNWSVGFYNQCDDSILDVDFVAENRIEIHNLNKYFKFVGQDAPSALPIEQFVASYNEFMSAAHGTKARRIMRYYLFEESDGSH